MIVGTSTNQALEFHKTRRRPDENILTYFQRLKTLLLYSSGNTPDQLEKDLGSIRNMYLKLLAAMTEAGRNELQRILDEKIDSGDIKFTELQSAMIRAARKLGNAMNNQATSFDITSLQSKIMEMEGRINRPTANTGERTYRNTTNMGDRTYGNRDNKCWRCGKNGHFRRTCRVYLGRTQGDHNEQVNSNQN